MILYEHYFRKKVFLLIMVITLTYCFLPFFINRPQNDQDNESTRDQHFSIKPVLASSDYSSFHPWAFHSGSGRLHLLFLHETLACDITIYAYYHMYKLADGSWVPPKKIEQVYFLLDVEQTKDGFTIFYLPYEILYGGHSYNELPLFAGIYKMEYNDVLAKWSDPVRLFGESRVRNYLELSDQQIQGYLHSFFLQGDETFFVVWSFEFYGQDVNLTHNYAKKYILSEVDNNGIVDSHPIYGLEGNYKSNCYVRVVEDDDSFYLYTYSYTKRAILFPNGTCSDWQDSLMPENVAENLPLTTFADHRVQQYWEVQEGQTKSVIDKRYLVYYPYKVGWQILDLASENLTVKSFISPYNIKPTGDGTGYRTFDFENIVSTTIQEVFLTPIFTNNTIELWELNYENTSWRQISSFDYNPTNHFNLLGESPIIELTIDDNNWRIFWAQEVRDGPTPLHEIFTVTYNNTTIKWSSVTQVTNTKTITNDCDYCESIPGLLLTFTLIGFIITVLFLKRYESDH